MKKKDREALWRQESPHDQVLIILGAIRGHLSNVEDGITDGKLLPGKLSAYIDDIELLTKTFMPKEWHDD